MRRRTGTDPGNPKRLPTQATGTARKQGRNEFIAPGGGTRTQRLGSETRESSPCLTFCISGTCTLLLRRVGWSLACLARPTLWAYGVLQAEFLDSSADPLVAAIGSSALEAQAHSL